VCEGVARPSRLSLREARRARSDAGRHNMIFKYNDRRSTPRTAAMSFSVLFRYALYIDSTRTVHRSSTDDRLAVPILETRLLGHIVVRERVHVPKTLYKYRRHWYLTTHAETPVLARSLAQRLASGTMSDFLCGATSPLRLPRVPRLRRAAHGAYEER
jgi:hypothetical protein